MCYEDSLKHIYSVRRIRASAAGHYFGVYYDARNVKESKRKQELKTKLEEFKELKHML